jgi:hypothetical protein
MPTLANSRIPRPKEWSEFQDITLSALKIRWNSPSLQQNGRSGQAQAGVDIFGPDNLGRAVGVQCKSTTDELELRDIETEIEKAETFEPSLTAFFVATAGDRDVKIQTELRVLSEKRLVQARFPVGILFWEDLMEDLTKDIEALEKHYPDLFRSDDKRSTLDLLSILDVAYLGSNIQDTIGLVFGEVGQLLQENPFQIDVHFRTIAACSRTLMAADEYETFERLCLFTAAACHQGRWSDVQGFVLRIEGAVNALEYKFSGRFLAAFTLGKLFSRWNTLGSPEKPLKGLARNLSEVAKALTGDTILAGELANLVENYNENRSISVVGIPHDAYNLVRRVLHREKMQG